MWNQIRSFAMKAVTKAKSKSPNSSANTSPSTQNAPSFSPPRHRPTRPLAEEQQTTDLEEIIISYRGSDRGSMSNTGTLKMTENKTYAEGPPHEPVADRRVDTTEKEVVTNQVQPSHAQRAVVGLGITQPNRCPFSEQEVHDGLPQQLYHEQEDQRQRLRELEAKLESLNDRCDEQAGELKEEVQDLSNEVKRLETLFWGS